MLKRKENDKEQAVGNFTNKSTAGVFVFNLFHMLTNFKIELYRISKAIVGINTRIDECFRERISFLENFATI
jgi:hypothetical protein